MGQGLDKVRTKSKVWVRLVGVIRVGFAASLPRPCPDLAQTLLFAYSLQFFYLATTCPILYDTSVIVNSKRWLQMGLEPTITIVCNIGYNMTLILPIILAELNL